MENKILKIVSRHLSINEDDISLDSDLINDLGADSLDGVELVMILESEFDIEIFDDEISDIKTVQDIIDTVNRLI